MNFRIFSTFGRLSASLHPQRLRLLNSLVDVHRRGGDDKDEWAKRSVDIIFSSRLLSRRVDRHANDVTLTG